MAEAAACRVCGCTDDRACEGGCWWVEDDLCSTCADLMPATPPDLATAARRLLQACAKVTADGMIDDDDDWRRALCGVSAALAAGPAMPAAPRDLPVLREADERHIADLGASP